MKDYIDLGNNAERDIWTMWDFLIVIDLLFGLVNKMNYSSKNFWFSEENGLRSVNKCQAGKNLLNIDHRIV